MNSGSPERLRLDRAHQSCIDQQALRQLKQPLNCVERSSQRRIDLLQSNTEQVLPPCVAIKQRYWNSRTWRDQNSGAVEKLKPRHTGRNPKCEEPRHPLGFGALFRCRFQRSARKKSRLNRAASHLVLPLKVMSASPG